MVPWRKQLDGSMALSQLVVDQLKKFGYLFYVAPEEDLFVENLEDKKAFSVEVSSLREGIKMSSELTHSLRECRGCRGEGNGRRSFRYVTSFCAAESCDPQESSSFTAHCLRNGDSCLKRIFGNVEGTLDKGNILIEKRVQGTERDS